MSIVKSRKGVDQLCFGGHIYRKNTASKTTLSWRCTTSGCKGTATTSINYLSPGLTVLARGEHNHTPDPKQTSARIALGKMDQQAVLATSEPPRRIISTISSSLSKETQAALPNYVNLAKRIRRKRRANEVSAPLPEALENLEIPEECQTVTVNESRERFLLHSDANEIENLKDGEKRVIIMATDTMLDQLDSTSIWMGDGTFKVVPKFFYQLYTIHVVRGDIAIPCVYLLMAGKSYETYVRAFKLLKKYKPTLAPRVVTVDFEMAAMMAFAAVFPGVSTQGCFFHLAQSIWRKVQRLGLHCDYVNDDTCRMFCKYLAALAFLEPEHVIKEFELIDTKRKEMNLGDKMEALYTYFEEYYVGKKAIDDERRRPVYSVEMWNVRLRTEEGIPRTNNKIEAWHRAVQSMYDAAHPNIWLFLTGLKKEEVLQRARLGALLDGKTVKDGKSRYDMANDKL